MGSVSYCQSARRVGIAENTLDSLPRRRPCRRCYQSEPEGCRMVAQYWVLRREQKMNTSKLTPVATLALLFVAFLASGSQLPPRPAWERGGVTAVCPAGYTLVYWSIEIPTVCVENSKLARLESKGCSAGYVRTSVVSLRQRIDTCVWFRALQQPSCPRGYTRVLIKSEESGCVPKGSVVSLLQTECPSGYIQTGTVDPPAADICVSRNALNTATYRRYEKK